MTDTRTLQHVVSVLSERWVLTLATHDPTAPEVPYPTPLFYALVESPVALGSRGPCLVFVSASTTRHAAQLGAGPTPAAAATYLETTNVAELRGAQLRGQVWRADTLNARVGGGGTLAAELRRAYVERHPVARAALEGETPPSSYLFVVSWAKLTDNRVGLGHHPEWSRDERGTRP